MGNSVNLGRSQNTLIGASQNNYPLLSSFLAACTIASFTLATASYFPAMADGVSQPSATTVALPKSAKKGFKVTFNGKTLALPWYKWQSGKIQRIGIADVPLMESFGVELLDTSDRNFQPWRWYGNTSGKTAVKFVNPYRYLDVTQLAKAAGWKLQISGDILQITAPNVQIQNIKLPAAPQIAPTPQIEANPNPQLTPTPVTPQPQPQRFTIALDKPTPWKISPGKGTSTLTVWGHPVAEVLAKFAPKVPVLQSGIPQPLEIEDTTPTQPQTVAPDNSNLPQLKALEDRTEIRFNVPSGWQTKITSASNPSRLIVDIVPDGFKSKNIQWSRGIKWRQQYVSLGIDKFAVTWLEINPKQVQIKPIWSNPQSLVGTSALGKTGSLWQAIAGINAGFFNRNLLVPLGALKRDRQWISSPILNRGAIAWNDTGEFKIAKAVWKETIKANSGEIPVVQLNSGFIEPGFSRYTSAWGTTYTPLSNNETILVVENNAVTNQIVAGLAGQTPIPIPAKGYLLTLRGASPNLLTVGSQISLDTKILPAELSRYPQVIGAGPVLMQNRQIVLDGASEGFKEPFMKQTAIRSAIATTSSGQILLVAVHNRAGGAGATLTELAQLLQQIGAVDALNLDGGSSTSLYLGGQLIDRSPNTAARVHNAIGIFVPSR